MVLRLIGDGPGDRLTDPPGGIGRELVAALVLELVHRLHQPDVAFLNQVEELEAAVGVLLGDRYDQAQVRLGELALGLEGLAGRLPISIDGFADGLSIHPDLALALPQCPLDLLDLLGNRRDALRITAELLERLLPLLAATGGEQGEPLEFGAAQLEGPRGTLGLPLQLAQLPGHLLEVRADPEKPRPREARLEQQIHAAAIALLDLFLQVAARLIAGARVGDRAVALADLALETPDAGEHLEQHPAALVGAVLRLRVVEPVEHRLGLDLVPAKLVAEVQHLANAIRVSHGGVEHLVLSGLDPLGDLHFALAAEQ